MPLTRSGPVHAASVQGVRGRAGSGQGWTAEMGSIVKFPDEGRIVRFGRADAPQSATVIILPVIRIERHDEQIEAVIRHIDGVFVAAG